MDKLLNLTQRFVKYFENTYFDWNKRKSVKFSYIMDVFVH